MVLNSLSGELLHASWKCVAKFGTMVEIGKRDLIGKAELAMDRFENNRAYISLDLAELWAHKPKVASQILNRVIQLAGQCKLRPISPIKVFAAAKIKEAFRYMQSDRHMGKIVVTFPESLTGEEGSHVVAPEGILKAEPCRRELHLRGDRSYVFAGGLGGLGQSIATYLVEKGARHLIFFSRSAGTFDTFHPEFFQDLNSLGCEVQAIGGSINEMADVKKVIAAATHPIAGVLQAAMVLQVCICIAIDEDCINKFQDANFVDMTFEAWQTAVKPKVLGTWNFDKALQKQEESLDFFFLFSSTCGTVGQVGQANYAAANTFMDAYVQHRRARGLACSALAIGVMEDVGFLVHEHHLLNALRATSLHLLHERELLDSLELMIGARASNDTMDAEMDSAKRDRVSAPFTRGYVSPGNIVIGLRSKLPLLSPMNRTGWKKNPRLLVYRNIESQDASQTGPAANTDLKEFLSSCSKSPEMLETEDAVQFLAREIGATLFTFMMRIDEEPDLMLPLAKVGVDSLINIELRNWFRQKLGVSHTVVELLGTANIVDLGRITAVKLAKKYLICGTS